MPITKEQDKIFSDDKIFISRTTLKLNRHASQGTRGATNQPNKIFNTTGSKVGYLNSS